LLCCDKLKRVSRQKRSSFATDYLTKKKMKLKLTWCRCQSLLFQKPKKITEMSSLIPITMKTSIFRFKNCLRKVVIAVRDP
jgi:hypothetical protein